MKFTRNECSQVARQLDGLFGVNFLTSATTVRADYQNGRRRG